MKISSLLLAALISGVALAAACGGGSSPSTSPTIPLPTATPEPVGGDVYVFGNGKVAIVDAATGSVVKTISDGLQGITSWDDTVRSADGRRLYVSAHSKNEVLVFDTVARSLLKVIPVGVNPVHLSLVNGGTELWSHSDAEGTFYVIDISSLNVIDKVDASTTHSGHGALVAPPIGTEYYATNVNTPGLFVIDARTRKVTKTIALCKGSDGTGGGHGVGFTAENRYVYVQCSGTLAKVAVVDTSDDTFVQYLDSSGDIYTAPDGSVAAIANSHANTLDLINASPGLVSISSVPIPNRAASAFFDRVDGKTLAFVADLKSPDVEVVDVAAKTIAKTIPGTPLAGQGPDTIVPRSSDLGGGYFYTIVRPTGVLNIIDVHTLAVTASVTVDGAFTVAFVGKPAAS